MDSINYIETKKTKFFEDLEEEDKKFTNPFSYGSEKIHLRERIFIDELAEPKRIVKIATISLPPVEESNKIFAKSASGSRLEYPLNRTIYKYSEKYSNLLFEQFKKGIRQAAKTFQADIICINELGMPLNEKGEAREDAIKFAKEIAEIYKCLIVAGTNHSSKTYLNTGYLFYPGKDEKNNPFRKFYKHISAHYTSPEEIIFTPSQRRIFYANVFGVNVAFLICLELADFSCASAVVKSRQEIDLLIVLLSI